MAIDQSRIGATTIESATRYVLPNGVVALIQNNPSSMTVSVRGNLRIGAVDEDPAKNGLAVFTGSSLIRGTQHRSYQQIVAETEERGASVNAGGGQHSSGFGGRALPEDLPLVLEILSDMLITPTFPQQEFERLRGQFLMNLRESEQESGVQAARAIRSLLFPPEHPYSRSTMGTLATVEGITREDLIAFHRGYHPATMVIAVVGAVDPAEVITLLETSFSRWEPAGSPPEQTLPPVPPLQGVTRRDIPLPGKSQSDLVLAFHGLQRSDPDFYAAAVGNMILGQIGMGGRLGDNVREKQGLAYYCGSSFDADIGAGPWAARAGVNPAHVERAISAILHEIEQFSAEGPSDQELSDARDYMTGRLVLGLETNDGIAGTLLAIERYGLGLDYISRYPALIRSVDAEQIVTVIRKYLTLDRYVLAVSGASEA